MTIEEVRQLRYLSLEIKNLKLELEALDEERTYINAAILSSLPKNRGEYKNPWDRYLIKQQELQYKLFNLTKELQKKRQKLEEFMKGIEDIETRLVIRLRCIHNKTWEDIGQEIGVSRRTASRIFYRYFEDCVRQKIKFDHNDRST